jgi:hypothetical protein
VHRSSRSRWKSSDLCHLSPAIISNASYS